MNPIKILFEHYLNIHYFFINQHILNVLNNDYIELKQSNIHGKGIFAKKNIPSNTIITFYPVHILIFKPLNLWISLVNKEIKNYIEISAYKMSNSQNENLIKNDFIIIGSPKINKKGFFGHRINHSNNHNCYIKLWPYNTIITNRTILKGEEITINYGQNYWTSEQYINSKIYYFDYLLLNNRFYPIININKNWKNIIINPDYNLIENINNKLQKYYEYKYTNLFLPNLPITNIID